MIFDLHLPWYINSCYFIVVFLTLLWQTYYCQLLFSIALEQKAKRFVQEGLILIGLLALAYLVEKNYSYLVFSFGLPFVWYRIWKNSNSIRKLVYNDINYNTYKQAWDSLPIPVAIANNQKELILINSAMFDFFSNQLHKKMRNLDRLWRYLENPSNNRFKVTKKAGRLVLQLNDGSVYWAELENFSLEGEKYWQLTLTDITNQDKLLARERVNNVLDEEKVGLSQLLANLEEIKRQEVAEEIHGRVHDFMGQRIAALQRLLSAGDNIDASQLQPILNNVLQDMRISTLQTTQEQLNNIVESFSSMGLSLKIQGCLPERQDWALCFVNMIREGATNAVRHGEATEVEVELGAAEESAYIRITSNGKVPVNLEKGKGLQGMEKSLQELNGHLNIEITDKFILVGEVGVKLNEDTNS